MNPLLQNLGENTHTHLFRTEGISRVEELGTQHRECNEISLHSKALYTLVKLLFELLEEEAEETRHC